MISDGKKAHIGDPFLKGATVTGTIVDHGRDKKILVYKKKRGKDIKEKMVIDNGLQTLNLIQLIVVIFLQPRKNFDKRNII